MNTINEILEALKPFEESSRLLEGEEYPTLHCVYPQIHKLKTLCSVRNNYSEVLSNFKERLLFYINDVVVPNINILHKVVLFLFPPANKLQNFEESEKTEIREECVKMMEVYQNVDRSG